MARRYNDAYALLHRLLDRHESAAGERSLAERPVASFPEVQAEERFRGVVDAACQAGGVEVVMGRGELSHLVDRVTLRDPDRLYVFLGREPRGTRIAQAETSLQAVLHDRTEGEGRRVATAELARLSEAWSRGDRPLRLAPEDQEEASSYLRALAAVANRSASDQRDLRTFSRQALGDSKLIERQMTRILQAARLHGLIEKDIPDEDAVRQLGLEKFPHLVELAGSLPALASIGGPLRHGGIPSEAIGEIDIPAVDVLLTVENYASFHRHIREAMGESELVVYTGGWPDRGTRAFLRRAAPFAKCTAHWGDIDMAGAAIADQVWRVVERPVTLHLMSPDLALAHGARRSDRLLQISDASPAHGLAAWLASPSAHVLEQEEIDPHPVLFEAERPTSEAAP